MRLSLDTNVFLWLLAQPSRIPADVEDAITDPSNDVALSVAAVWEIIIKTGLGKLQMPGDVFSWLPAELSRRNIAVLDVKLQHVVALEHIPLHHRDPFDRVLVAQARVEGLTIVTHNRAFAKYDVPVLWA